LANSAGPGDNIYILFEPYDDGSAEFVYPPKATHYRLTPIVVEEGDNAVQKFEEWTKGLQEEE
jgi:hypothetical protein